MPKPFANLTGNGCHSHISFYVGIKEGSKNLFEDKKNKLGLSKMAYLFGGSIALCRPLCAIFNPIQIKSLPAIDACFPEPSSPAAMIPAWQDKGWWLHPNRNSNRPISGTRTRWVRLLPE